MDLNRAQILGRVTQNPEVRTTPSGTSVVAFSIATNLTWKSPEGEQREKVEYHNVVAWRRLAEICGQYLTQGRQVYVEGRLQTRSWEGQDGVKRYRTEIIADNVILLGGKGPVKTEEEIPPPGEKIPKELAEQEKPKEKIEEEEGKKETESKEEEQTEDTEDEEIKIEDIPF